MSEQGLLVFLHTLFLVLSLRSSVVLVNVKSTSCTDVEVQLFSPKRPRHSALSTWIHRSRGQRMIIPALSLGLPSFGSSQDDITKASGPSERYGVGGHQKCRNCESVDSSYLSSPFNMLMFTVSGIPESAPGDRDRVFSLIDANSVC